MMRLSKDEIGPRAEAIVAEAETSAARVVAGLRPALTGQSRVTTPAGQLKLELCDGESVVGGGAAPSAVFPHPVISLSHAGVRARRLSTLLPPRGPPLIPPRGEGRGLRCLCTVFPPDDAHLVSSP